MNYKRNYIIFFILGALVAFVPTFLYFHSVKKQSTPQTLVTPKEEAPLVEDKGDAKTPLEEEKILPYKFEPNALAIRKPIYIQILRTHREVKKLRKTGVYLADQVDINDGVRMSPKGLDIFLRRELNSDTYHITKIRPLKKDEINIKGFNYIPNAILNADPSEIQLINTEAELKSAQNDKDMTYKDDLELGGGVICLSQIPCYGVTKDDIREKLIIKPLNPSNV